MHDVSQALQVDLDSLCDNPKGPRHMCQLCRNRQQIANLFTEGPSTANIELELCKLVQLGPPHTSVRSKLKDAPCMSSAQTCSAA